MSQKRRSKDRQKRLEECELGRKKDKMNEGCDRWTVRGRWKENPKMAAVRARCTRRVEQQRG